MKGAFTNIQDLYDWFINVPQNEGKYILYHGTVARANGNNSMRCLYNEDARLGVEDAWEQIKSFLARSRGGEYTLLVKEGQKHTGPRAFFDQTGRVAGSVSGASNYAAFGGVEEYIGMRLKVDELERRLEEREPELGFLERVFTPELIQEFVMSIVPGMTQGSIPTHEESSSPSPDTGRSGKIQALVEAINGLDDDQLDSVTKAISNPAIVNMLNQGSQ